MDTSSEWPDSVAAVWQHVLTPQTLAAAAADSDAMAACAPNFWMPREAVEPARERVSRTAAVTV